MSRANRASWWFITLFVAYIGAHLLGWVPTVESREVTWTNPTNMFMTCGGDTCYVGGLPRLITPEEATWVLVQMKTASEPDSMYATIDSLPWSPGSVSTYEAEAPGYGDFDYRVAQVTVDWAGNRKRLCPSTVWTWTIVDTCVSGRTTDFGPSR